MRSVDAILEDLDAHDKARIVVFNKEDQVAARETIPALCRRHDAVAISAINPSTFQALTTRLKALLPAT